MRNKSFRQRKARQIREPPDARWPPRSRSQLHGVYQLLSPSAVVRHQDHSAATTANRIRPIPKPIDRETARRATDVIEQMSLLLREHMVKSKRYTYLSRPKRNPPSMSIRSIMLGTTEEDAKTCLVIFCADSHRAHDRIRDFLRKSFVKELYQPRDSTEPSFDVHVVGASPSTQAGVAVGIPINNCQPEPSTCTLCGTSIYFVQEESEQKQFATMGGILRLEFPDGTNDLYGLTAEQ
ncbi:hypothetical protein ACJ41O_001085 [Fusarium nematophilum]